MILERFVGQSVSVSLVGHANRHDAFNGILRGTDEHGILLEDEVTHRVLYISHNVVSVIAPNIERH